MPHAAQNPPKCDTCGADVPWSRDRDGPITKLPCRKCAGAPPKTSVDSVKLSVDFQIMQDVGVGFFWRVKNPLGAEGVEGKWHGPHTTEQAAHDAIQHFLNTQFKQGSVKTRRRMP